MELGPLETLVPRLAEHVEEAAQASFVVEGPATSARLNLSAPLLVAGAVAAVLDHLEANLEGQSLADLQALRAQIAGPGA